MIGLGKLGLPVAVGMVAKGHTVYGYDINPDALGNFDYDREKSPEDDLTFEQYAEKYPICLRDNIWDVCEEAEIIFVAVQTPHEPEYEGVTRIPKTRANFNYKYLFDALKEINSTLGSLKMNKLVVVISTVLPGTLRTCMNTLDNLVLLYNPFFIGMGTVLQDFFNPEFVLIGSKYAGLPSEISDFYKTIHNKPILPMMVESAELVKVAYNTMIGMKIVFANTLMEICQKIPGSNVDDVTNALKHATDRLISPKYLTAGMGDGGGCHPRDNIAMSWLAQKLNLSHDIFSDIMKAREDHADYLAKLVAAYSVISNLPIGIIGYTFKPESPLLTGSPALLVKALLVEKGIPEKEIMMWDQFDSDTRFAYVDKQPRVFLVGTKHEYLRNYKFPKGSVVIDPFRFIPNEEGVNVIRIGENDR